MRNSSTLGFLSDLESCANSGLTQRLQWKRLGPKIMVTQLMMEKLQLAKKLDPCLALDEEYSANSTVEKVRQNAYSVDMVWR
mmetsp:Transcript_9191/g.11866  ORF Transcript_9191/g.11866 Transcript_9191/m.11866 type:complete len:82 (-) Transcript_9191:329-574(-)